VQLQGGLAEHRKRALPAGLRANLRRKVDFLRAPESYPEACSHVDVVETHMAFVFLTASHAYKLKKPVRYDFLDFSTIEARRRDCELEVQLNRRLAENVYLGVVGLSLTSAGQLSLNGEGRKVDWLVKMRRLPADRMLDVAIAEATVTDEDVRRVAGVLAEFYRSAPVADIAPAWYSERVERDLRDNLKELCRSAFGLDALCIGRTGAAQMSFLHREARQLDERVRQGHVVDGHGDLRPEHICLLPEPVIIDCIEFNEEFRVVDAADEIAFLALECEWLDAADIGERFIGAYRELAADDVPTKLMDFYTSSRAILRAKLAAWHTDDPEVDDHAAWLEQSRKYLELAQAHARSL
jgi:aminoglycoside phosphotransferase family enzyme